MQAKKPSKKAQKKAREVPIKDIGILRIFLGFLKTRILGVPDPIYEKVVLIKKIKKKLKRNSLKGINFAKDKLTADFARILYEIYKYYSPLRSVIDFNKPSQSRKFTDHLVKKFSAEKQKEDMKLLLSEEYIKENLLNEGSKKTAKKLKGIYKDFSRSFTGDQAQRINHLYSLGESLNNFLKFDLYMLIKKFAPDMKEDNVYSQPNFREVDFSQVETLLKDFTDHVYMLNPDANYYQFIEEYGEFIGSDIIPKEDFDKFIKILIRLIKTEYLIQLVQYISRDVFFRPLSSYTEKNILNEFLREIAGFVNGIQNKVSQQVKTDKINRILEELFETSDFEAITTYTPEQSEYLIKNNVGAFAYTDALNGVKKFMLDKYNHYIRKTVHTVIVKASFSSPDFREQLNTLYYQANELIEKILDFERSLKEKGGWEKVQALIRGKVRDSSLLYLAKKNVTEINQEASALVDDFIRILDGLKDKIRILVTAYNKTEKKPISNIRTFAGTTTTQLMKYLAQGFNDIGKMLSYLKIVHTREED
jgi:hypothetical protein